MRCFFLAAVFIARIAAQQLGSSSDPCVGGNPWPTPLLRFGDFICTIPAPVGTYTVTLGFQEPTVTAVGGRLFDISINGLPVIAGFDLVAAGATSSSVVITRSFTVVSDGNIRIQLSTIKRSAVLSSITVVPIAANPAVTWEMITVDCSVDLNCTGGKPATRVRLSRKPNFLYMILYLPFNVFPLAQVKAIPNPQSADITFEELNLMDHDQLFVVYQ